MKRLVVLGIVAVLFAGSASGQDSKKPATPDSSKAEKETRYLAFQIFTYGPDPKVATHGRGDEPNRQVPGQGGASRLHRGHQTADRHRGRPADPTGRHAGALSALIMVTPRSPSSSSLRLIGPRNRCGCRFPYRRFHVLGQAQGPVERSE